MEKIIWIIYGMKQETIIEFETSKFFKWLIIMLMRKRKIKVRTIKRERLKGQQISQVFIDEAVNL